MPPAHHYLMTRFLVWVLYFCQLGLALATFHTLLKLFATVDLWSAAKYAFSAWTTLLGVVKGQEVVVSMKRLDNLERTRNGTGKKDGTGN